GNSSPFNHSKRSAQKMPDMHGTVFCSDRPFTVVEGAVFCAHTIDIVLGPRLVFAICDPGPIIDGVNVGKRAAGDTTPLLAHLKNLIIVVNDHWDGKRRNNTIEGRWQDLLHQYFVGSEKIY